MDVLHFCNPQAIKIYHLQINLVMTEVFLCFYLHKKQGLEYYFRLIFNPHSLLTWVRIIHCCVHICVSSVYFFKIDIKQARIDQGKFIGLNKRLHGHSDVVGCAVDHSINLKKYCLQIFRRQN